MCVKPVLGCSFLRLHFRLLFLRHLLRLTHTAHCRVANIMIIVAVAVGGGRKRKKNDVTRGCPGIIPGFYPVTLFFFNSIFSSIHFILFTRYLFFPTTTRLTPAARKVHSHPVWRGSQVLTAVPVFRQDSFGAAAEKMFDRPAFFFHVKLFCFL